RRTCPYAPGAVPAVLEAWGKAVPIREKLSPLAACWTSELGGLNKFVHVWPDKNSGERTRIREEARKGGPWPPPSGVRPGRQENKSPIRAALAPLGYLPASRSTCPGGRRREADAHPGRHLEALPLARRMVVTSQGDKRDGIAQPSARAVGCRAPL